MGTPVKSHIIFQAYGSEDILHECLFALLSLSRVLAPEERASVQICIYTDRPSFFQRYSDCPLNIVYRLLEEPQVRLWRGTIDFVHRVKIEVLRDYSASHSGAFLYLDTDVVFTESPLPILEDIGKGAFYMHIMEGVLKESAHPLLRKAASFLATRKIRVQGKDVIIPPKAAMWNAGVLGFDSQSAHLLEEVLAFTDTVYPLFRKHIVEQLAFSLRLQLTGTIRTAHTRVSHYWNLKEIRPVLASFFAACSDCKWTEKERLARLIQLPDYLQQKANFYANRSIGDKIAGKKWVATIPDWALLFKQL